MLRTNSKNRYVKQNKSGTNNKTKHRNQVMLRGRGCRANRSGMNIHRGPGRTAHGRRR